MSTLSWDSEVLTMNAIIYLSVVKNKELKAMLTWVAIYNKSQFYKEHFFDSTVPYL